MHLIFTANYSPWSSYSGGGQRSTHNLATALAHLGHNVDVVFTKSKFERVSVPSHIAYTLHWALLPSLKSKRASWLRNLTIFSVYRKVKSLLSDNSIMHCNGEEGALLYLLKRSQNAFLVLTPRYPHIPASVQNTSPSVFQSFVHIKNTKYHLLGNTLQTSDMCSPTSNFTLRMLENHYCFNQTHKVVIPNGVDTDFLQAPRKTDFTGPLIYFGRLAKSKGVDTLIKGISYVKNSDLKLLIVGRGEEKRSLKNLAKNLHIDQQITFKSWMPQDELIELLTSASMAVLPSREESFGNTMAESMATGTPVVSTTAGSIPEVVINGKTGLLVPPDDPQALAGAIQKLHRNHCFSRKIADNARRHVKKNFTWKAVAQDYEKEYKKLLS